MFREKFFNLFKNIRDIFQLLSFLFRDDSNIEALLLCSSQCDFQNCEELLALVCMCVCDVSCSALN